MASKLIVDNIKTTAIENFYSGFDSMTINSSGICFRPNLPYFIATRSSYGIETGSGYMAFPNVLSQRGNWYDGGSAVAPEKGLYAFFCKTLTPDDGQIVDLRWYVNGAVSDNYGAGYSGNWSGYKYMESFVIFELKQNDSVRVYNINTGTRCCDVHNTYMGYLIGG